MRETAAEEAAVEGLARQQREGRERREAEHAAAQEPASLRFADRRAELEERVERSEMQAKKRLWRNSFLPETCGPRCLEGGTKWRRRSCTRATAPRLVLFMLGHRAVQVGAEIAAEPDEGAAMVEVAAAPQATLPSHTGPFSRQTTSAQSC